MDNNIDESYFSPFDLENGALDKISPPPDFDGPVQKRRITDPLCLLVLLGVWGVTTWMGIWSLGAGNYNAFVHQVDYKGRVCGLDNDSNGNKLPILLHVVDTLSNGICVTECPTTSNLEPTSRSDLICKDNSDLLSMTACLNGTDISNDPKTLITCGGCMYSMGVKQVKNQCLPESATEIITKVNDVATTLGLEPLSGWTSFKLQSYITVFMSDLNTGFSIVAGAFGGSALLGLLVLGLFLIPSIIHFTVWITAILVPFAFGGGGAFLWFLSSKYESDKSGVHSEFDSLFMFIMAIVLWSFAGISFVTLVIMREKINLSIALTKAGTRAIREVKFAFLFPVLQFVFYTIFVGVVALWLIFFSTTGVLVEKTESVFGNDITYTTQQFTTFAHYKFWFLMLVFVWTSSFIITFGRVALSLCFAKWYFTPEKDEGNSVSVVSCTLTTMIKHAGTVSFASLAMGPLVVIRTPFLLLQKCIRFSKMDNVCIDALICSCQCSFFVLERFLKYTSKNTFVQTAIFGHSFCKGSHESYYLIKRNERNISDAGPIGFLCTFFTRIFLCAVICLGSYYALDEMYGKDLYCIEMLTFVIGLMSWFIIGFFMETVGMSVTTLFQCFLADEEMLGNEGSLYVPNEIDEFLSCLDETRKSKQSTVPKVIGGDDEYTVDSGMVGGTANVGVVLSLDGDSTIGSRKHI